MIICNGNAKAGRHVLTKTVELLGVPFDRTGIRLDDDVCISGHWPHPLYVLKNPTSIPTGKHIHIVRNPRNMLVSWVRFTRSEVLPGYLIGAFKSFYEDKPIYDEFMDYLPYLSDPAILNVRFEDLIADKEDQRIADFIGVPMLPGILERRPGGTATWTGKLSNWEEHWSDQIEDAWIKARGPEVEKLFGYGK